MSLLEVIGIAIGLAMDTTAIGIATAIMLGGVTRRQVFRFAFHFGLFQALMPALGWLGGTAFYSLIAAWDHWVAFGLLTLVGGKALLEALRDNDTDDESAKASGRKPATDPTRGLSLVMLSVATSIDAFAVGLSFAMLQQSIVLPCVIIGVVTAAQTALAMLLGHRLQARAGRGVRVLGGVILCGIGIKILLEHLLA